VFKERVFVSCHPFGEAVAFSGFVTNCLAVWFGLSKLKGITL
jgi:hypothetical protein